MNNLSLWHVDTQHSELRNTTNPIGKQFTEVKAAYSMISTGTEKMVALGKVAPALAAKMAVPWMDGGFELPIKYGYSLVGHCKGGDNIIEPNTSKPVHLLHPHQQIAHVDPSCLYELPDSRPLRRMTLLSNMETIVNALWDAEAILTHSHCASLNVAICGFGNIGALLGITLKSLYPCNITVVEADAWRLEQASSMNFTTFHPSQPAGEFDLIFHTSCTQDGLNWCIQHTNYEASIIELSWYVDKLITLSLGGHFHYNRVRLISSQVSNIPKNKPNETYQSRKQYASKLLENDEYDHLFAEDIPFTDAPDFFKMLRSGQLSNGLVWCFKY